MSGQSLVMFVSLVAIAIAANRAEEFSSWPQEKSSARGPASINGKKDISLAHKDLLKHTHKVRGPLAAAVELVGQRPEQPGDVFVLKGVVSSESSLENVEFSWGVPEGVEVVNGQVSSVIAVLGEEHAFETQITLRQVSPLNERVTLRVRGHEGEMRFGDTAVYHSMDQEKVEAARQELKLTTESYMSSSAEGKQSEKMSDEKKPLKVMH